MVLNHNTKGRIKKIKEQSMHVTKQNEANLFLTNQKHAYELTTPQPRVL